MSKANSNSTTIGTGTRVLALALGGAIVGAECFGAYDYVIRLDGFSYLAVAGPLAPAIAALSLPFAERAKAAKQYVKAIALGIAFIFAACTVIYTMSERVHDAKAGNEAERVAKSAAAARAETSLSEAKAKVDVVTAAADKVRGLDLKQCGPKCQSIRASETAAKARVSEAETAVRRAQGQATTSSDIKPPSWLLPVALFFAGVVFVWYGSGTKGRVTVGSIAHVEEIKPVAVTPVVDTSIHDKAAKKSRKRTTQRQRKGRSAQLISWEKASRQARAANEN
jgi:hypothetical protein